MIAKIHKTIKGETVLVVCDSDILGKCYEEDNLQLDLSSNFYKGKEMSEKRILNLLKTVRIAHLVGKKSIELGIKAGIIEKENIIKIKGIPHAEAVIVREE